MRSITFTGALPSRPAKTVFPSPSIWAALPSPSAKPLLLLLLLGLCVSSSLSQPATADATAGAATVSCAPGEGNSCIENPGGFFNLTATPQQTTGLNFSSWFFNGEFSFSLKLERGDYMTRLVITDAIQDKTDQNHAEMSIVLYGNSSSVNHTTMVATVCSQGQHTDSQFHLPFDGSADFHEYTLRWNLNSITWLVDGTPIRILYNNRNDPWPMHPLRPQFYVGTSAPKDAPQEAISSSLVKNMKIEGCAVPQDAGVDGCPSETDGALPWNKALTAEDFKAYNLWHYTQLDYDNGWRQVEK